MLRLASELPILLAECISVTSGATELRNFSELVRSLHGIFFCLVSTPVTEARHASSTAKSKARLNTSKWQCTSLM